MLKIGITGGIGSGKTYVCHIFKKLGVPVYSADERARELVNSDKRLQAAIIRDFGENAFSEGIYNRSYMAKIVFRDPARLARLNQIIHPVVTADFARWAGSYLHLAYVLHEAAILFESGTYQLMDRTLLVDAPEPLRIRRIINRDHTDQDSVETRMKNQWSTDKIRPMADWIILNDEKSLILPQVLTIHKELLNG